MPTSPHEKTANSPEIIVKNGFIRWDDVGIVPYAWY